MMITKQVLTPDFCVIGAGSGGLSFAAGALQMGASVVLLERNKMGGDCLNYGCIPSKALIAAAKIGYVLRENNNFGWSANNAKVDFEKVHNHVHSVMKSIAPHDSVERFEGLGAQVILEEGRFLDEHTLETITHLVKAKRFIIATGSYPFVPNIFKAVPHYTNESIFDLKILPDHLVVVGSGPLGIEMAQAFKRFGSQVTVLGSSSFLPKDDPEITSKLRKILIQEGVDIKEHIQITSVNQSDKEIKLTYTDEKDEQFEVKASHILVATGRRPNIQTLNLDVAKIKISPKGIEVGNNLRTSNPKVYAIGDCTGGYQFTHVAGYHAGLVIRSSIFKLKTKVETHTIPWVTYTDPELAHVGFSELQLKDQKIPYKVLQMDLDKNDRAQTERRTEGTIKVLVSLKGHVLGATILGLHAGELIYPWVMSIQNKLKISAITSSIAPYPTLSDLNKRVAGSFYTDKLFSASMKKLVRFLMRLTK